jgi:hypothetical protein
MSAACHRRSRAMKTYVVTFGGGRGPDFWVGKIEVEAETMREALDKAEVQLREHEIFAIEEEICNPGKLALRLPSGENM